MSLPAPAGSAPAVVTPTGAPLIEVLSAEQVYPNGTRALQPVDLQVRAGEFVTLLGPSGCGKSTLLKMIAGLLAPTDGRVRLGRREVAPRGAGSRVEPRLSFVFQEATLMPWARVAANVRLPLDLAGVPRTEADARVRDALSLVGLNDFERHRPRELSGGMQMRVSIARGLVTDPQLLLMDEPFGALDEITRHRLDGELLQLWQQRGLTVVFVTHSIFEAVYLSSRVIVMAARPGRVVADVPIDAPYPRDARFRTSSAFTEHARALQELLLQASGVEDGA